MGLSARRTHARVASCASDVVLSHRLSIEL